MTSTPSTSQALPAFQSITARADIEVLRDVSPEMKAAVLANSNVKIFLKFDGAAD